MIKRCEIKKGAKMHLLQSGSKKYENCLFSLSYFCEVPNNPYHKLCFETKTFFQPALMYNEPPTNKQGIQTNAELFVIQNMVV